MSLLKEGEEKFRLYSEVDDTVLCQSPQYCTFVDLLTIHRSTLYGDIFRVIAEMLHIASTWIPSPMPGERWTKQR